jgi:N-methylhydantoinase A/acetophenone carboxylase
MPLHRGKAERAIRERIADPLGVGVEEAAALIRRIVDQNMNSAIKREIHLRGYHPEDFILFAFGGAGPTHVAGFLGDLAGAVIFQTAPVFCALGSSIMDIVHVYETSRRMIVMAPISQQLTTGYDAFNEVVDQLIEQARADLKAEGLPLDEAEFSLELDMLYGGQVNVKRTACPVLHLRGQQDVEALYDEFEREFSEAFSPLVVNRPGGVYLDNFVLKVTLPTPKPALPDLPAQGADAGAALTGKRQAWWPGHGWTDTSIYDADALRHGHRLEGPAILEAPLTTVVVPPGMRYAVDRHGLGLLEASKNGGVR